MRKEGKNLASPDILPTEKLLKSYARKNRSESCVFISYSSVNKSIAFEVGEYIRKAGIDIYLDIFDKELQKNVAANNDEGITKMIEEGVANSSDILCIVSQSTKKSWWVPYELGYGKNISNSISTLLLKDVDDIPSYLKISHLITGIKGLNEYLLNLVNNEEKFYLEKSNNDNINISAHTNKDHRLKNYLHEVS